MSLLSWLQQLRTVRVGSRRHPGRLSPRRTRSQPLRFERLEDRFTLSFTGPAVYSVPDFIEMSGPDTRYSDGLWSDTADFNGDGWNDIITVTSEEYGTNWVGWIYLSGASGEPQTFDPGPSPYWIATGDFSRDGRPDFAIYNYYIDAYYVYFNAGPGIRVTEYSHVWEGDTGTTDAAFGVNLDYPTQVDVTVSYATAEDRPDATATPGSDYIPVSGTVTIPAGQTSATFAVAVVGDRLAESTESFLVRVSGGGQSFLAYGVIHDNDAPQISIGDATVTEGNAGSRSATFAVNLSAPSSDAVTVAYTTGDGAATAGSDYQTASGTLTFAPGQTSQAVTVQVHGDRLAEPDETFFVNLSNATNAAIANGQGIGTIQDDEPRVSISDVTRSEGKKGKTTLFTFTVILSAAYDQSVTMSFRTVNGTASTSNGDYVGKSGKLTFAPGETTKTITIEVRGDSKKEADETFYVDLFGLSSNALFTKNRGVGTILNDD